MAVQNPRKLIFAALLAVVIALLLAFQAISGVAFKRAPELAISLMPNNGTAREQFAFAEFSSRVTDPQDTQAAAIYASDEARRVLRTESLSPKAYAILAMAQADDAARKNVIALATNLNRRDLSLQSLWLTEKLAEGNFLATAEALDRILRVHPRYREQFFPVLGEALEDPENLSQFARLLGGEAQWHTQFVRYAAGQRQLQPNLALLRTQIKIENDSIDRSLIIGLVRQGLYREAHALYAHLVENPPVDSDLVIGPWRSTYPPFDWYFADQTGFRAQPSFDGESLELSVRPGKGGVIAERFIRAGEGPMTVKISHRIAPAEQLRDVRLQANCAGSGTPYFDERFVPGEAIFALPQAPEECEFISLVINARAWSGRSSLSGTIESFKIEESSSASEG